MAASMPSTLWAREFLSAMILPSSFFAISVIVLAIALIMDFRRRRLRERELKELRTIKRHLDAALWGSGDGLWDWDLSSGSITRSGVNEMLGFKPDQLPQSVSHMFDGIHADDRASFLQAVGRHLAGETDFFEMEYRVKHVQGQWRWVLQRGRLLDASQRDDGRMHLAGTLKDITARKNIERELQFSWTVLENMSECVVMANHDFKIIRVNTAFTKLFGYSHSEILGCDTSVFDDESALPPLDVRDQARSSGHWQGELWQRRKNKDVRLMQLDLKRINEPLTGEYNYVAVMTDITERRKQEAELRYLADYDYLTGLANRQAFQRSISAKLNAIDAPVSPVALMFLDLDHFKQVNDSLGHLAGDSLLQQIAARLRVSVTEHDVLARLGGDEFVAVINGVNVPSILNQRAQQLLNAFKMPFIIEGQEIIMTPSVGISCFPEHATDVGRLLQLADLALYQAKKEGRGRVCIYTDELQSQGRRRLGLENAIRKALSQSELEVWFQPRWDVRADAVTGFEALVRWHSSAFGPVRPDEFISIAEEIDLITDIGDWVLNNACQQAAFWWKHHHCWRVSVNLSAKQLQQPHLFERVQAALRNSGLPPYALELELTESQLLMASTSVAENLKALRELGVRMSLDDFGTGYSAFSYLRDYRFDTLKLPKEFVSHIETDVPCQAIISAMIALAHKLDMTVVAEGVETSEQHKRLRQMQCDEVQGYFIGEPISAQLLAEDMEEIIG